MLEVLLTVPHGAPGNDVLGPLVAQALHRRLAEAGIRSRCLISRADRLEVADMNRAEGRRSDFRAAVAETIQQSRPAFLIDCHSFPDYHEPYGHADIVLLETPGLTDRAFLESYVELLNAVATKAGLAEAFRATIEPARFPDDVLIHARELGHPANAFMLAEHNESGDPALYAAIHEGALSIFLARLREQGEQGGEGEEAVPDARDREEEKRLAKAGYLEVRVPFACGNCKHNGGPVTDGRFEEPVRCQLHEATVERSGCCDSFFPGVAGDVIRGA